MDRTTVRQIQAELGEAAKIIAAKYGLGIGHQKGTIGGDTFKLSVEFKSSDAEKNIWTNYAGLFGLKVEDLGRTFKVGTREYKIVAVEPSRSKFPIIAEHAGKKYKFPAVDVVTALRREASSPTLV